MAGSKLPGELTWPKLLGTTIAAVVAAWLAGHLGLGNTLSGVAIGSVIATFGAAFFTSSIDKSHQAIVVRTDRGTVVESRADSDIDAPSGTTVLPAQPTETFAVAGPEQPSRWRQIHWRSVVVAAIVTMAVTLAAISIYEGAVGRTWGSNEPGTTIGNTVRGGPQTPETPPPTPTEEPTQTPTPSEEPTEEPTPTDSPSPSPSPSESTDPDACATTAAPTPATPTPSPCPTTPSPGGSGGLLR